MEGRNHVEHELGLKFVTLQEAMTAISFAESRYENFGIVKFNIYELKASFPFKSPADDSKTPS
jgi:hypothetical protein